MRGCSSITTTLAACLLATLAGTLSHAQIDERLSIHGFGGWAAGYTSNDNDFNDVASNDLALDNYYFTLNLLARPFDSVAVHAQPTWESNLRGREAHLDLVYVEWSFATDVSLRAGKIRNPLGIYTEIFKVGTLRPFYLLPNASYRHGPESYTGLGLNHLQKVGDWELELDVLGGKMDFLPNVTDLMVGMNPETNRPIFASVVSQREGRKLIGGGILVRPPIEGLEISLAGYNTDIYAGPMGQPVTDVGEERTTAINVGLEYMTNRLWLRAEGLDARGDIDFQTGFVELAYKLTDNWQVAAQYDVLRRKDPPAIVKALSDHSAFGFALNYWVNSSVVWKANYYRVTDNYLARPEDAVNRALAGELARDTDVFVLGVHFAF
jgi:hypothetical protein